MDIVWCLQQMNRFYGDTLGPRRLFSLMCGHFEIAGGVHVHFGSLTSPTHCIYDKRAPKWLILWSVARLYNTYGQKKIVGNNIKREDSRAITT